MDRIHIAVDAMGGDEAPRVPVEGAWLAVQSLPVLLRAGKGERTLKALAARDALGFLGLLQRV